MREMWRWRGKLWTRAVQDRQCQVCWKCAIHVKSRGKLTIPRRADNQMGELVQILKLTYSFVPTLRRDHCELT